MKRYTSIALMLIVFLHSELCRSEPTFGNEYVHIKVHVPKDQSSAASHKVIHHYHHRPSRRRPSKKTAPKNHQSKHNALLESIILSEVKRPISSDHLEYLNHAADIAEHIAKPVETYVVKQEDSKPRKKVNTFTIIEETKKIPQQHGESDHYTDQSHHPTIDTKGPHRENAYSWKDESPHIETVRVIDDSKKTYHTHADNYRNGARKQIETIKVIDASEDSYDAHGQNAGYRYENRKPKPQIETIRIFDSKENHPPYKSRPQTEEIVYETHSNPAGNGYQYAPHTNTVKIVETKVTKHNYNNFDERPHTGHTGFKSELPEETKYYHGHYEDAVKPDGGYQYERPSSSEHNHNQHGDNAHYDSKPIYEQEEYVVHSDYTRSKDPYLLDETLAPPRGKQNTLFDDEVSYKYTSVPVTTHNGATDWPERRENDYTAAETYTGIDSYSASHVQGVGSGGYQYPLPYP